jgi:hypothetical protein
MSLKTSATDGREPRWTKSSYSTNDGPDCVEVAWRRSSYSSNDGPECVEVAATREIILIRDSKNITGPRLGVAPRAWRDFVAHVTAG